jgi:hypothetical protein
MANRSERRVAPRIKVDLLVHVRGPTRKETALLSHDWSARGVFLRTQVPFLVGTPVELYVVIGHPAEKIPLVGKVSRRILPDEPGVQTPGMMIALEELPPGLRGFLEESARAPVRTGVTLQATVEPCIIVIGGDHPSRAEVGHSLALDGYDVREVDHGLGAIELLSRGLTPHALVIIDDTGETLAGLKDHLSLTSPPDVVVTVGVPPRDLGQGLGIPVVLLPRNSPQEQLLQLLKLFVQGEKIDLEMVRSLDEPRISSGDGALEPVTVV